MATHGLTDLLSLFGDLLDFLRSAHEALLERRRKRADEKKNRARDNTDAFQRR